jgi:hypothetical protein
LDEIGSSPFGGLQMMRWAMGCLCMVSVLVCSSSKVIYVPSTMTTEITVSNERGFLNGKYDVRARLFNLKTRELLWAQDLVKVPIQEGSMVLTMNDVGQKIDAEVFHDDNVSFVITLDGHSLELPFLTELYSYRSLFSEFAWDTRYHEVLHVDRDKKYVAIGRSDKTPKADLDVGGAINIGYEDTQVTGAIRLSEDRSTIQVRHPDKWVDLTESPSNFIRSRWTLSNETSMFLTSPNYKVGIFTESPDAALEVVGDVWILKDLNVEGVTVNAITLKDMSLLSNGTLDLKSLELNDSTIFWSVNGLHLENVPIIGNGEGLFNVGGINTNGMDDVFDSAFIQSHHLSTDSILEKHFSSDGVFTSRNIKDNSLPMDRFVEHVFEASFIGENSIASNNFQANMFSNDYFDNALRDLLMNQVSEGFITFESNIIATNSILGDNFFSNQFLSNNLVADIFDATSFGDDVIRGAHVVTNAIQMEHFATGTIPGDKIVGVLTVEQGGTSINTVESSRLVSYDANKFVFLENIMVADNGYLHIASSETNALSSVPLRVGVHAQIYHHGNKDVPVMALELDNSSANIRISESQNFHFGDLNKGIGVQKNNGSVFFGGLDESSAGAKFVLNGLITIATANNDEPEVGTIEYRSEEDVFRFYGESGWTYAYSGFGVGDPINVASILDLNDTYLGQSEHSYVRATASMITDVDDALVQVQEASLRGIVSSMIRGQRMDLDHIMGATVDGDSIVGGQVARSQVRADLAHVRQVSDSFLQGARFTGQQIQRSTVMAQDAEVVQVQGATIDASNSVVRGVRDVTVDVMDSMVVGVADTDITGQGLDVRQVQDSVIVADGSRVAQVQGATIQGAGHTILNAQLAQVQGNRNVVMASDGANVMGDDNRVFGDDQWIRGDSNTVFGRDIKVEGHNNIVFHAGNDPLQVVGDDQIVLSAPNGIHIATGPDMVVSATEMGGGWSMVSDRTLKTNFTPVDYKNVFNKLMALPITEWEYTFSKGVRHIGPMAQDFKQAFGLGSDERFITATDADGVAYAAIKHLISELDNLPKVTPANVASRLDGLQRVLDDTGAVLDAVDQSLALKKSALDVIADRNYDQYKLLDKQFKGLAKLPPVPTWWWLGWRIGVIFGIFFIGTALGFWGIKRYYNRG